MKNIEGNLTEKNVKQFVQNNVRKLKISVQKEFKKLSFLISRIKLNSSLDDDVFGGNSQQS
jgi:hypothetical protein